MKTQRKIRVLKADVNSLKSKLITIMSELESVGTIRAANSLSTIIARLEAWQNRYEEEHHENLCFEHRPRQDREISR